MRVLLSNDDGYLSAGLAVLAAAIREHAEVVVVAPDRNQSGASHSLTLESPLRVTRIADDIFCVNGTPTDCVHLAITGFLDSEPDMVIAGINHGANLGDDVLYSGTVAAAVEGRFLGLPAVAVSLAAETTDNLDAAGRAVTELFGRLVRNPLPADTILNVNVPDRPWSAMQGFAATRLGFRHRAEPVVESRDPRGRPVYWVGAAGRGQDAGPGTDFDAVEKGCVSVTPIQMDLTRHDALPSLAQWLR